MTSTKENIESVGKTRKVDLKNLAVILQDNLNDKNLKVIEYSATNFVPIGENFGSIMIKLDVTIKSEGKTEKLHLLAKTINPSDKPIFKWPVAVQREVFIFEKLLPAYRNLEREMGFKKTELFDSAPKYYGHRKSLNDEFGGDEFDDDSLFLMENLKVKNYFTVNKQVGFDLDFARITTIALARFHALGIVLKKKKPEFFKDVIRQTESLAIDIEQIDGGFIGVLKNFYERRNFFEKHLEAIESSFNQTLKGKRFTVQSEEPWMTVTHGDLWINNILYHKNQDKVDDVKFVDFQIFNYNSPLRDVTHFLCGSLEDQTLINHLDELLDDYYNKFTETLELMGCSSEPFTRASFEKELKTMAIREFPQCAMCRKYFAYQIKDEKSSTQLLTNFFESTCTDAMVKRYQVLVDVYVKKGWF